MSISMSSWDWCAELMKRAEVLWQVRLWLAAVILPKNCEIFVSERFKAADGKAQRGAMFDEIKDKASCLWHRHGQSGTD